MKSMLLCTSNVVVLPWDLGSSFLQCPRRTLPSPSSPFTKPGGQYTKDSVVRKKLCRAIAAFVNVTTFSGLAMIGRRNILHL